METSASFEARSAPSSYPTSSQSGFCAAPPRPDGRASIRGAPATDRCHHRGNPRHRGLNRSSMKTRFVFEQTSDLSHGHAFR